MSLTRELCHLLEEPVVVMERGKLEGDLGLQSLNSARQL